MRILVNQSKGKHKEKVSKSCISAINGQRKVTFNICHFLRQPNELAKFY
jgi:hypothetical protein